MLIPFPWTRQMNTVIKTQGGHVRVNIDQWSTGYTESILETGKWEETQIRIMGIITLALEGKDKASERALKQMRTEMNVLGWEKEEKNEEGEKI